MATFFDTKEESYRAQRNAAQGAGITLVCGCGEFVATFDSATRCASILGNQRLRDLGDGIYEVIPEYKIPLEEIAIALGKLTARYSVSLVDIVAEKTSSRFVLVWKIQPPAANAVPAKVIYNIEDF